MRYRCQSSVVVSHGVSPRFIGLATAREYPEGHQRRPFRWLYVSIIDFYKHQSTVAVATAMLKAAGLPVQTTFIGPANPRALGRFEKTLKEIDPKGAFLRYDGPIPFEELHRYYHEADGFIFASTCENLPNILIEAMAAGLPIICSSRPPMPEVLRNAGVYFDPEVAGEIAAAMRRVQSDSELRSRIAQKARGYAANYSWRACAQQTFAYLASIAKKYRDGCDKK